LHPILGQQLCARSEWPAVENGVRLDDVTFYNTISYDAQTYYDRYGSIYREAQSVHSGIRLR